MAFHDTHGPGTGTSRLSVVRDSLPARLGIPTPVQDPVVASIRADFQHTIAALIVIGSPCSQDHNEPPARRYIQLLRPDLPSWLCDRDPSVGAGPLTTSSIILRAASGLGEGTGVRPGSRACIDPSSPMPSSRFPACSTTSSSSAAVTATTANCWSRSTLRLISPPASIFAFYIKSRTVEKLLFWLVVSSRGL